MILIIIYLENVLKYLKTLKIIIKIYTHVFKVSKMFLFFFPFILLLTAFNLNIFENGVNSFIY